MSDYEFLFMQASGDQLRQITALVDDGALRPVVGQVFAFDQTISGSGRPGRGGVRGKAVITHPLSRRHDVSSDRHRPHHAGDPP